MAVDASSAREAARLAESLAREAAGRGMRVAVCESLTSGAVAQTLGKAPDAADWFSGGIVAYDARVKFGLLGVPEGPVVTAAAARAMAEGAMTRLCADLVAAVTGVGGPGPEEGRPPGTVFLAHGRRGGIVVEELLLPGDPEDVVNETIVVVLRRLLEDLRAAAETGRAEPAPLTVGIEEECTLVDPSTLRPVDRAAEVIERLVERFPDGVRAEFLASQLEVSSPACEGVDEAASALRRLRSAVAEEASRLGAVAASTGTPFDTAPDPVVTPGERYQRVREDIGAIIDDHQVCGMHVHVGIPDRDLRARALDELRPWVPMLTALAANSPFWHAKDTGFDSWRTIVMRRWSTLGVPAPVGDWAGYSERVRQVVGLGLTRDVGLISWMVRLSHHLPTLEFRFADAQLDVDDTAAVAELCRLLAVAALRGTASARFGAEQLDAAIWSAARDGHRAVVPDPTTGEMLPLPLVVAHALDAVEADDRGRATVQGLLDRRSGADRQRRVYAGGGTSALADLIRVG